MTSFPQMPTYLGEPLYPGGAPLKSEDCSINGETIWNIYERYLIEKESKDDMLILKNYLQYYIHAPVFDSEYSDELRKTDFSKLDFYFAETLCEEYGLSPF